MSDILGQALYAPAPMRAALRAADVCRRCTEGHAPGILITDAGDAWLSLCTRGAHKHERAPAMVLLLGRAGDLPVANRALERAPLPRIDRLVGRARDLPASLGTLDLVPFADVVLAEALGVVTWRLVSVRRTPGLLGLDMRANPIAIIAATQPGARRVRKALKEETGT